MVSFPICSCIIMIIDLTRFMLCFIRDEKLFELLKTKKAAESQFRKMRLGYEGPKRIKTRKVVDDKENNGNSENKDIQEKVVFKPTATKQQFVSNFCLMTLCQWMVSLITYAVHYNWNRRMQRKIEIRQLNNTIRG